MFAMSLLLALGSPGAATEDAARERLDALIEETNALEAFHVEYRTEREGGPGRLRFDFQAPDALRLRSDSPRVHVDQGCADSVQWNVFFPSEGEDYQARVDLLDTGGEIEEALALFEDEFWRPPEAWRVHLGLAWWPAEDATDMTFWVGHDATEAFRPGVLLGWLDTMRSLEGELVLEGDELVHRSPGAEVRVDANTGFLTSMVLSDRDGGEVRIVLDRLELEPEHDDVFVPPELDPDLADSSEDLRGWLLNTLHLRGNALRHVYWLAQRNSGRVDGQAEGELRRMVAALIRPSIVEQYADWIARVQDRHERFGEWLRECVDQGVDREQIDAAVSEMRTLLEQSVDPEELDLESSTPPDPEGLADDPVWRELRDLEDDARIELYLEVVAEPLLDQFELLVEEALGS